MDIFVLLDVSKSMKVNDKAFTCDDFAYGVVTGDLTGPCARFCKKCVECAPQGGDTASWCAKEDGIVCAKACESQFVSYVTKFEDIAKANTGIKSVSDINCSDWAGTAQQAGDIPALK